MSRVHVWRTRNRGMFAYDVARDGRDDLGGALPPRYLPLMVAVTALCRHRLLDLGARLAGPSRVTSRRGTRFRWQFTARHSRLVPPVNGGAEGLECLH